MALLLFVHIVGGALALLAGALALAVRKGARLHHVAGWCFVTGMLLMALPGGVLAHLEAKPFDVLSSGMVTYMVLTGWYSIRQPPLVGLVAFVLIGLGCAGGYLFIELPNVRRMRLWAQALYLRRFCCWP